MPRTLADLKSKPKQLPTWTVRICLDLEALADVQRLDAEKRDLLLDVQRGEVGEDGERKGPPKRTGEGAEPPRVAEIEAEKAALFDRMRESEGDVLFRAIPGGQWQLFKDENPPRQKVVGDKLVMNKSDEDYTYGICDASALMANLGRWAVSWNGEAFAAGDWEGMFADQVAPGDLAEMCREVLQYQETRLRVPPKASTGSSATPENATS